MRNAVIDMKKNDTRRSNEELRSPMAIVSLCEAEIGKQKGSVMQRHVSFGSM